MPQQTTSDSNEIGEALVLAGLAVALWKGLEYITGGSKTEESQRLVQEANALYERGEIKGALEKLGKAIEKDKQNALAYNQIAWFLATDASTLPPSAARTQELQQAFNYATRAVELETNPKIKGNYHDTLAEVYFQTGQYDEAIVEFKRALALAPDLDKQDSAYPANFRLGICYQAKNNLTAAREAFLRAIADGTQNPFVYGALGDVCFNLGSYHEAVQYYAQVPTLGAKWQFPDAQFARQWMANVLVNAGSAYYHLGNLPEWKRMNEHARQFDHASPYPLANLASERARQSDATGMRQYLEAAMPLLIVERDQALISFFKTEPNFEPYRAMVYQLLLGHQKISPREFAEWRTAQNAAPAKKISKPARPRRKSSAAPANVTYNIHGVTESTLVIGDENRVRVQTNTSDARANALQTIRAAIEKSDLSALKKQDALHYVEQLGRALATPASAQRTEAIARYTEKLQAEVQGTSVLPLLGGPLGELLP